MVHRQFTGGVFSERLDGGRAGADVELLPTEVSARTADGELFSVPYGQCHVEVGGFSGRMVFCRNHDRSLTIFCEDRAFPDALSQTAMGLLDDQLGQQLAERRRASRVGRRIGFVVVVGLVLLLVGGYLGIRVAASSAVKAVPVSVDRQIGVHAFSAMDLEGPEIDDPKIVGPLQAIVDRLAPHASVDGMEFKLHVVDSPTLNAFCLPGGTMVVFTGLIEQAENANQVAGVLGHEMAHATMRHGLERIGQAIGLAAAVNLLLGDAHALVVAGGELFQMATINSYSREQEADADAEGVRMLHAAKIDPTDFGDFFRIMHEAHGDVPGALAWISTHPQHEDRKAAIDQLVAALPKQDYQPLEIDWEAYQQQVAERRADAD